MTFLKVSTISSLLSSLQAIILPSPKDCGALMYTPHTPKDQSSTSFSSMHVSCNEGTPSKSTLGQKWQDFLRHEMAC